MEYMPFKCGQCGNWYTPVPMPEDLMCLKCAEGKHAVNAKKGTYDCHWGHTTATTSEVQMAELRQRVQSVYELVGQTATALDRAEDFDTVTAALTHMEQSFAQLEKVLGGMPEILRWAGVKTMPGLKGSPNNRRFLGLEAVENLVGDNRRPQTDVDDLKRSIKTCAGIAGSITDMVATVRVAVSRVRRQAETCTPPVTQTARAETFAAPVAAPLYRAPVRPAAKKKPKQKARALAHA